MSPSGANARLILERMPLRPRFGLVLGSGLGTLLESVAGRTEIPYTDLSGFPVPGVSGHGGSLVIGHLAGTPVAILTGRSHYYEHGRADAMRVPLETLREIGVATLILTNSAGSLRQEIGPGSLMLISDHLNLAGANPLIGEPTDHRFVGMTQAYDVDLRSWAERSAEMARIPLATGVYAWFSGPSFETPAEIRAARVLGADAVGMSTVPETILARFLGMKVLAFSVITNHAAGMTGGELSHQETKDNAPKGGRTLARLLETMFRSGADD